MSTAELYVERARGWARYLEDREATRRGVPVREARPLVARALQLPAGMLQNLRDNRLKTVAAHAYERLRQAVEGELAAEIARAEHELALARAAGLDAASPAFQALEALTGEARGLVSSGEKQ